MIKKLFNFMLAAFIILTITSCATTKTVEPAEIKLAEPCTITRIEDSVFWEINGIDKNGEPSKVYVLGSIHVGDQRLFPLAGEVEYAFDKADRLVSELSSEDWSDMMFATMVRQGESGLKENQRVRKTEKPLAYYLTEEQKDFLASVFGGEQALFTMMQYEPWVLLSSLNVLPMNMSGLSPMSGVDTYLLQVAMMAGRSLEGLDTLETQLDLMSYGDWNIQLEMLIETIDELMNSPEDCVKDLTDLYNAYLSADIEEIEKLVVGDMLKEEADYTEDYYKVMFIDRNKAWADKFAEYIYEGGETFVFAGSGHFVGDDSVFEFMKRKGTLK